MDLFSITSAIILFIIIIVIIFIIKYCRCNNNDNNDNNNFNRTYNNSINQSYNPATNPYYNPENNNNYNINFTNIHNNVNENDILNLSMKTYFDDINNNLDKLNKFEYSKIEELYGLDIKNNNISCPICFEYYNNNDFIYDLQCKHIFHSKCLIKIAYNNAICPLCRKNLFN